MAHTKGKAKAKRDRAMRAGSPVTLQGTARRQTYFKADATTVATGATNGRVANTAKEAKE